MKKLTVALVLSLLALASALPAAASGPALNGSVDVLTAIGADVPVWMYSVDSVVSRFGNAECRAKSSQWCEYRWYIGPGCCVAVHVAAGASCPTMCI